MAYSLYEETQVNSPKSVQYYPEEYDYPSYYQKISEVKVNYPADRSTKKNKKASSSISYVNERKCPIYVHQYNNNQNVSTYNNYSSKATVKPSVEKNSPKPKKIPGFPTTKSVLDQLEETYWATWKPNNKENVAMSKKNRVHDNRARKIKPYGDVPDNISHYFASSECDTSIVEESDYERYNIYETVIKMHDVHEREKVMPMLKTTHTQEIQTDSELLTLPKIEEHIENSETIKKEQSEVKREPAEEKEISTEKSTEEDSEETTNKEKSKLLKHTDSFIINKKKQSEVKEHFQQPKCIRLYRKPGISTSSFIRGGSYPLKSCLKREPVPKGNFRLGAPGSPLFVSTGSFHRKSRK